MKIIFYNTTSEKNRIEKVLTDEKIIEGNFKNSVSVLYPVITLNTENFNYNYCYIQQLNRYYFIDAIEITRTNLYTINLKIDVLQSYKNDIKNLSVVISQSNKNPYYNGYIKGVDSRTNIIRKNFENNFNESGTNILLALNGELLA